MRCENDAQTHAGRVGAQTKTKKKRTQDEINRAKSNPLLADAGHRYETKKEKGNRNKLVRLINNIGRVYTPVVIAHGFPQRIDVAGGAGMKSAIRCIPYRVHRACRRTGTPMCSSSSSNGKKDFRKEKINLSAL